MGGDALGAAQLADGGGQAIAAFADQAAGQARVFLEGEQQMLYRQIVVFEALGFLLGVGEELGEAGGDVDLLGRAGGRSDFGKFFEFLFQPAAELVRIEAGFAQDVDG